MTERRQGRKKINILIAVATLRVAVGIAAEDAENLQLCPPDDERLTARTWYPTVNLCSRSKRSRAFAASGTAKASTGASRHQNGSQANSARRGIPSANGRVIWQKRIDSCAKCRNDPSFATTSMTSKRLPRRTVRYKYGVYPP